jgi:hypothetical protein
MNRYLELKQKQQKEINEFPFAFAFNDAQFEKGMRKLGLEPDNIGAIYKFGDTGGFYRRTDGQALFDMMERHEAEMKAAIDADPTGDGFIFEMFRYELSNHEYGYTGNVTATLEALDLTMADIRASDKLKNSLQKAITWIYENSDL